MTWRNLVAVLLVTVAAGAFGCYLTFPSSAPEAVLPAVSADEQAQTIIALKPLRNRRPLVAILGANDGSETTDYIIPYGVLKRSGLVDVVALGVSDAPVTLMPVLTIIPDASQVSFDSAHPEGADYVIVPAFHHRKNPPALAWLNSQAGKGAMIVGICEGALVLAEAGLLKGKHATTHWHAIEEMKSIEPGVTYVPDRRYIVDGRVATTTGVSASLPVSLAIVEAIGGRDAANRVAADIGLPGWGVAHSSRSFNLTRRDVRTVLSNVLGFWRHDDIGIPVTSGTDEISLALVADAYSRTFAARVTALGISPVRSMNGLRFLATGTSDGLLQVGLHSGPAVDAFNQSLNEITARYGADTASFVRLTLEYPQLR
ncbi:MAG: DJ-1/PfpI family protein [Micropepsaceae bacterium]